MKDAFEIAKEVIITSTRPVCPRCDTASLVGELYTWEDGSTTTICKFCGATIRIKLILESTGVRIKTEEI